MNVSQAIAMVTDSVESVQFLNYVDKFMADDRPDCCGKCAELYDVIQKRTADMLEEFQNPNIPRYGKRAILCATALITMSQIMFQTGIDDDSSPESANDNSGG